MEKEKVQSVSYALVGSVLQLTSVALISGLGFVLVIVGLGKLKDNLDEQGASAVELIRKLQFFITTSLALKLTTGSL